METVTGLDLIEKAIIFVNYLQNVFTPLLYGNFRTREKDIGHYKYSLFWERRIDKINKSEVLSIVKKLKKKKAPGYNLITDQILKKLPDKGIVYLTQLFAMLRLNFIPPPWNTTLIKMILKPGKNLDDPKFYKPTSLLLIQTTSLWIITCV